MTESDEIRGRLLRHIANLQEHYSLSQLNPLGCGGVADFYTEALTPAQLIDAAQGAARAGVPCLVIGEANHILFSDGGFPGLVVRNRCQQLVVSPEHTRVVVDSGIPLDMVITRAADQGLGGLELFYGQECTVGGAIYNGLSIGGQSILSYVRGVTVLQPRVEGEAEAAIIQHPGEWLKSPDRPSRLYRAEGSVTVRPAPILLSVVLQGTRVRQDELLLRLHDRLGEIRTGLPRGEYLGPIFRAPEGMDINLLLNESGAGRLRLNGVYPDRRSPNFLRRKGPVLSADVWQLVTAMKERVQEYYGVPIVARLEPVGVW